MSHVADGEAVHIIASLFNGARYIEAFVASLRAQSHEAWRLWVRDDGSTDETLTIVRRLASVEPRITLLEGTEARLGAAAGFAWLLERVPPTSRYVMCADQDDVWLPDKIARTLDVMRVTERSVVGPVLVHTDLIVVDDELRVIDPSFWHFAGIVPEPASLRRLVVQNVVTGATVMLNRPLRELVGVMPREAIFQDWWYACVASVFGTVVALREGTILYRQHGANAVGAREAPRPRLRQLPRLAREAWAQRAQLRHEIARTARQAQAFLDRYGDALDEADRRFLRDFARLPRHRFLRRKLEVVRLRLRPERGFWRNLGILLRA